MDLGLPEGVKTIRAAAISDDASIVVGTATVQQSQPGMVSRHAKVWTPHSGWQDFSEWLKTRAVESAGWKLDALDWVSGDGRTFAGQGRTSEGKTRGFVVNVPERAGDRATE